VVLLAYTDKGFKTAMLPVAFVATSRRKGVRNATCVFKASVYPKKNYLVALI
jgi:hypothetical protein